MSAKEQLTIARQKIMDKRYDEARVILEQVDHPVATEWLEKLDSIAPQRGEIFRSDRPLSANKIIPEQIYGFSKFEVFRRLLISILLLGISVAFVYLMRGDSGMDMDIGSILMLVLLVGGWFISGLWLGIPSLMAILGGRKTIISSEGVHRKTLTATKIIRWQAVEGEKGGLTRLIYSGIPLFTYGAFSFYVDGKVAFQVCNLDARPYEIYDQITQQIIAHQTDHLIKQFDMGESLKFNSLSVKIELQQDGLRSGKKVLPLHDIEEVIASADDVRIIQKNGKVWKQFSLPEMYNPWLFTEVVNSIVSR